jgi:hypothetical protein
MGKIVWKKLRSRKGASITFALLAFLVCAVISAVLLASASAAAGRVSGLAESDQRYYAVTSAAQLFCDGLQNQEITIERLHETKETKARVFWRAAVLCPVAAIPMSQMPKHTIMITILFG